MLDIGFSELVLIGVIALIALGPKQLPEVARAVARFINEMKRTVGEFSGSIVDAREETNRFLVALDKKPRPPRSHAAERQPPRFALTPEREALSPEEEADRRRQMAFPMFDDVHAGRKGSGDVRG